MDDFTNYLGVLNLVTIGILLLLKFCSIISLLSFPVAIVIILIEIIGSQTGKIIYKDSYYSLYDAEEAIKTEMKRKKYIAKEETISLIKLKDNILTIEKE